MTDVREPGTLARAVFAGLEPSPRVNGHPAGQAAGTPLAATRVSPLVPAGLRATSALVLAGTFTVAMTLTGPLDASALQAKRPKQPPATEAEGQERASVAVAVAPARDIPATYTVTAGDTISGISARYGLSTASVLTLNGLSWKSLIFPGQILKLKKPTSTKSPVAAPDTPASSTSSTYSVKAGDTISAIAKKFGVAVQKVLDANRLTWSSIIYPGQKITIPGAATSPSAARPSVSAPLEVEEIANARPTTLYYYLVKSGDTLSAIAKGHGVSLQSVLDANKLKLSSIIYPGQRIVIPGRSGSDAGSAITTLTNEQGGNATIIIAVGRTLGVSDRGIVVALAAAMQESSLRNIGYGDLDSVGLFQQRPSAGWGTVDEIMDPVHAARLFYGGPKNPNTGTTRGLLDISGWQSMTVTRAAQAVQVSAYPNAYAKWEASAWAWLAQFG